MLVKNSRGLWSGWRNVFTIALFRYQYIYIQGHSQRMRSKTIEIWRFQVQINLSALNVVFKWKIDYLIFWQRKKSLIVAGNHEDKKTVQYKFCTVVSEVSSFVGNPRTFITNFPSKLKNSVWIYITPNIMQLKRNLLNRVIKKLA